MHRSVWRAKIGFVCTRTAPEETVSMREKGREGEEDEKVNEVTCNLGSSDFMSSLGQGRPRISPPWGIMNRKKITLASHEQSIAQKKLQTKCTVSPMVLKIFSSHVPDLHDESIRCIFCPL